MESPAQIRRLRDLALARIARHESEIAVCRREIALYDELLRLHGEANRSSMRSNMQLDTAGKRKSTKIAAANTRNERASRAILLAADRSDQDVADELAKKFKADVGRSTVNAWHTGRRPIPRQFRDYLEEKYPGTGPAWPRVAD